jgi:hypothetical protein
MLRWLHNLNNELQVGIFSWAIVGQGRLQLLALVLQVPKPALRAQLQTHVHGARRLAVWLQVHLMQDAHAQVRWKPWQVAASDAFE